MRIRNDYVFGVTTGALTSGDTSMASAGLGRLADVASPDVAAVVLHDPATLVYEIVHVTAHTFGGTSATILRGREGTVARAWPTNTQWLHGVTAADLTTDLDTRYAPMGSVLRGNFYVGPEDPGFTQAGMWIQTGLGADGTDFTIWINDGT